MSDQVQRQSLMFPSKNSSFLPEPLRKTRSWNHSRLDLDPGSSTEGAQGIRLRLLFTVAIKECCPCHVIGKINEMVGTDSRFENK